MWGVASSLVFTHLCESKREKRTHLKTYLSNLTDWHDDIVINVLVLLKGETPIPIRRLLSIEQPLSRVHVHALLKTIHRLTHDTINASNYSEHDEEASITVKVRLDGINLICTSGFGQLFTADDTVRTNKAAPKLRQHSVREALVCAFVR